MTLSESSLPVIAIYYHKSNGLSLTTILTHRGLKTYHMFINSLESLSSLNGVRPQCSYVNDSFRKEPDAGKPHVRSSVRGVRP